MLRWLEIGVKFIKTLGGQWKDRSRPNAGGKADSSNVAEGSASGTDRIAVRPDGQISTGDLTSKANSIAVRPESQISIKAEEPPNGQELARRRETVRHFFNDFWSSTDEKPGTFAERLNQAEDYINERLTECGEAWLLDSATRKQLGLPPQSHRA